VTKQGDDDAHTFTAADDAKLIELKANGKTWKEIVAEMKKSQSALKERFKEIGPKAEDAGGTASGEQKKKEDEKKKSGGDEKATKDKKGDGQSQQVASSQRGKNDGKPANEGSEKVDVPTPPPPPASPRTRSPFHPKISQRNWFCHWQFARSLISYSARSVDM
jgi:Myb-like DNA-binding domain